MGGHGVPEGVDAEVLDVPAEELLHRGLRVGPRRALVDDLGLLRDQVVHLDEGQVVEGLRLVHHLVLALPGDRHDLLIELGDAPAVEVAGGKGTQALELLPFPLAVQHLHPVCDLPPGDLLGDLHALLEEGDDLFVDRIELFSGLL
jgi:hypothetical protein